MPKEDIGALDLPLDVATKSNGFSLDMGGSVMKLVYLDKTDYEEAVKNKTEKVTVRLVSFPANEVTEAIEYLKERCHIVRKEGSTTTIYGTGVGGYQFAPKMNKELNVSIEILMETDCFVKSLNYICEVMPYSTVCHERNKKILDELHELTITTKEKMDAFAESAKEMHFDTEITETDWTESRSNDTMIKYIEDLKISTPDSKPLADSDNIYPCIMAMLGSGFGYMKIGEDKKYAFIDLSNRGGRTFLGMGCMLTGAKTFDELIALAKAGNNKNVDVYTSFLGEEAKKNLPQDETEEDQKKNIYSEGLMMNDDIVYCFGQGVRKTAGDFKREDTALALLNMICMDISETLIANALLHGAKRIFFCGSFANSDLTRELLSTHLIKRQGMQDMFQQKVPYVTFDFIKGGSHLGAMGAFIFGGVHKA